jgi:hypothetical protein
MSVEMNLGPRLHHRHPSDPQQAIPFEVMNLISQPGKDNQPISQTPAIEGKDIVWHHPEVSTKQVATNLVLEERANGHGVMTCIFPPLIFYYVTYFPHSGNS